MERVLSRSVEPAPATMPTSRLPATANGTLDPRFGSGSSGADVWPCRDDQAFAAALEPNGAIVAAGVSSGVRDGDFALARFTARQLPRLIARAALAALAASDG